MSQRNPRDRYDARNPGVMPYGKYGMGDADVEREERERRAADAPASGGEASVSLREAGLNPRPAGTSVSNRANLNSGSARPRSGSEMGLYDDYGPTDTQVQEMSDTFTNRSRHEESVVRSPYGPEEPARPFNVDKFLTKKRADEAAATKKGPRWLQAMKKGSR